MFVMHLICVFAVACFELVVCYLYEFLVDASNHMCISLKLSVIGRLDSGEESNYL